MGFKDLLGDIGAGAFGLTGPTQAQNLGLPQAAGMTPQELQQLIQMPERQAQMEELKSRAEDRKASLQIQRDKVMKFRSSGSGDLTEDQRLALVHGFLRKKNPVPPSYLKTRGASPAVLADALISNPDYDPVASESEAGGRKAGKMASARLEEGGPPQVLARYAQSTKDVLKVVEETSKNYPRYGAQFLNTAYNKITEQSSPEALIFRQSVSDLRSHIAAVLAKGYAPQKEQQEDAKEYLPLSITPKQLVADLPFLNRLIDIQVKGMMTRVPPGTESIEKSGAGRAINGSQMPQAGGVLPKADDGRHKSLLDKYGVP